MWEPFSANSGSGMWWLCRAFLRQHKSLGCFHPTVSLSSARGERLAPLSWASQSSPALSLFPYPHASPLIKPWCIESCHGICFVNALDQHSSQDTWGLYSSGACTLVGREEINKERKLEHMGWRKEEEWKGGQKGAGREGRRLKARHVLLSWAKWANYE